MALIAREDPAIFDRVKPRILFREPARRHVFVIANSHSRVALLQSIPLTLKALKPKESNFIPVSLGEHIKKRRLELRLTHKEAGKHLGVTSFTITNWEKGHRKPSLLHIPAICQFLGYDPAPPSPDTLAEQLAAKRRQFGWSQRVAARKLGVDPSTWAGWEHGKTVISKANRYMVARFLGLSEDALYSLMRKQRSDSYNNIG